MRIGVAGVVVAFGLFGGLAHAQAQAFAKPLPAERAAFEACLREQAEAPQACLGVVQSPCLDRAENQNTVGQIQCTAREHALWDEELNRAYKALFARESPAQKKRLQAAQRAWIAFRDADCRHDAGRFDGGSLARVVAASCLLDHTSSRAIALRGRLEL